MSEVVDGVPNDQDGVNDQVNDSATSENSDLVPRSELSRAIDDIHKFKKQARELQAQLELAGSTRLREKEDFKALAELNEAKWKQEFESHAKTKQHVEQNYKYNAAYSALKNEGLISEADKLLDRDALEDMIVEYTDQGRYIVHGKETLVQRWKKDFPFAFKSNAAPRVNSGGGKPPEITSATVTVASVLNAEDQYRKGKIAKEDYVKVLSLFKNSRK